MGRWDEIHTFRYSGMRADLSSGAVSFDYTAEGFGTSHAFTDQFCFPPPPTPLDDEVADTVRLVLELLNVAVGLSYFKLMAPRRVELGSVRLAPTARRWAVQLYRQGLAQFAYRHDLPHILDLDLDGSDGPEATARSDVASHARRPLVAVGGGKDSIVSVEALKAAGRHPAVFALRPVPLLEEILELTEVPAFKVRRVLDKRAAPILKEQGGYKGHVPVTAVNTLAAVVTALLNGLGPVVMSNERSASAANVEWHGRPINHQWAKSLEAETLLRNALTAQAGLTNTCFSLLRGMSELHIAQLYAKIDGYDTKMTSCNNAFRFFARRSERWCNDCDKCRFVFLALAPFVERRRLIGIFGADLFDDLRSLIGYRELLGLSGFKPFECVGEVLESRVALGLLANDPGWAGSPVVAALSREIGQLPSAAEIAQVFTAVPPRFAPEAYALALADMQQRAEAMGSQPRLA
jgi:UDP-N-acetyl-alpha-D-muramoyl-L-alanyl-L-glutamate epimerase